MKQTALYDEHVKLRARLIPFGGFDMPVQYESILKEHEAVRKRAGLFDLSHMAQFVVEGEAAAEWADRLTVNAVPTMKLGQARYNIFTNEQGGAHDDVIFYRLDDQRWMVVVNAGNADKMWKYLNDNIGDSGVKLHSRHGKNALIAIQGPRSVAMLGTHVDFDLNALKYYFCTQGNVYGKDAIVARTGYTGEDGFEIFVDGRDASEIWTRLLADNAGAGLIPAGLGARDVLRLEAGMPLYGHELTEEITPLQAGLDWVVKLDKPQFVGETALATQKAADDFPRIVGIVMDGRAPAREGYHVFLGEKRVGEIRSGSIGPSVGNKSIGTALVEKEAATPGTDVVVHIRGTAYGAKVMQLPFYKRSYKIGAA
ncbi:MAG TPA: glycine cleavage system aminomethyltransferase GcvT [Candidatus Rubrimentiphilum sp.]|nr:glycine cleavage system aminomethyltransferase GcvT [Candidatus Rubrimentiphilum sp.]